MIGSPVTAHAAESSAALAGPLERTCFQSSQPHSETTHLPADVAIVYGIDPGLPERIKSWREQGYRIHVMTGVSWGHYQDYLYGRFDGTNHEDEAQTDRNGTKISHGGDVYYMCPGENYGKFLCVGVKRALDAGAEAIHLEEPEFWVNGGYSEGFKREWRSLYREEWTPPHESVDAAWRASKLKYYLYGRALQQVFDFVQEYNRQNHRQARCYVPTHSLLNYAHWRIVSPESSLARLQGCDGYIAQVWTGTARTPNLYHGELRERTFETAFLEYGALQNLVRSTGRIVWYLNDPVEDDPRHDWDDYHRNWESTLTASLLQPEVSRYEVMPWPDRVFGHAYPSAERPGERERIPAAYATELQTVINALNDMDQHPATWEGVSSRAGVIVSDSLMFERGEPSASDPHLSHFYGLALPLLKHGFPVEPVQLENATLNGFLAHEDLLLLTYQGMKPPNPEVHAALAAWVRAGGVLVVWDDDSDPYNRAREWWNTNGLHYATPRTHLFEQLGLAAEAKPGLHRVGKGTLYFRAENPDLLAADPHGDETILGAIRDATIGSRFRRADTNYLLLRRGKYVIAAGLDESSTSAPKTLHGAWVNLFDPLLKLQKSVSLTPGSRFFLLDVPTGSPRAPELLASACKVNGIQASTSSFKCLVDGIGQTEAIVLARAPGSPRSVTLDGRSLTEFRFEATSGLLWLHFPNEAHPRSLEITF